MQIQIESSCGRVYEMMANPHQSVLMLHKKLSREMGASIYDQLLTSNGAPLKWDQLLCEVSPDNFIKLQLDRRNSGHLPITVRIFRRAEIEIKIDPAMLVSQMKMLVFERTRIPPSQQTLMVGDVELEDGKSVNYYGLTMGSQIDLKECKCLDCPYRNRIY